MTVIAHLSDLHVGGAPRSLDRVRRVVDHLLGLGPGVDAVVVTGDVADHGSAEEYRAAREVLAPLRERYPVLLCPGNHDEPQAFREAFGASPVARTLGGLRVLLCDSSVPGRDDGLLTPDTLRWLDHTLAAERDAPALVGFHHPPVPLGVPFVDRIGLRDPQDLAAVLARHPQVVAVLCGHAHAACAAEFAGTPLRAAGGVVSTALLPWEPGVESSWKTEESWPSVLYHVYRDGRLTSHLRAVE